jgi:hypothetical protein
MVLALSRIAPIVLIAAALAGTASGEASPPSTPPPEPQAPAPPPRATHPLPATATPAPKVDIATRLRETRVTLEFADAPLVDVLAHVRDLSGIAFAIDARVAERLAKEPQKITLKIKDVPLESALKLILGGKKLAAVERKGMLVVVPQEDVETEVVVRVYDVRDLGALAPQDAPGPDLGLAPAGGDRVPPDAFRLTEPAPAAPRSALVDIIRKQCGVSTWGGPNVSIAHTNGMLIVAQTRRVHAEIQRLLALLRTSQ